MKRITAKDIANGLIIAMPIIIFMFPFYKDLAICLHNQKVQSSEPVVISYENPTYGYNPYICEENIKEIAVMKTVAYCSCEKCCGWNTGITYSGTVATQGRTVAANIDKFPIGTKMIIDGHEYIVEDTGNLSDYLLDIYFDNHEDAIKYGAQWKTVEIIRQGE